MRNILKLTLLLATASSPAYSVSKPASFKLLDANKDGYVSLTEAKADKKLQAAFTTIDKDYDSRISDKEYMAYIKQGQKKQK